MESNRLIVDTSCSGYLSKAHQRLQEEYERVGNYLASSTEPKLIETFLKEYVGEKEFGCLLISNRFGTKFGKHNTESYQSETNKIKKILSENKLPYFYWTYKPLEDTPFDFIDDVLDIRNVNLRVQMYIRCKAKLNVGNQSGTLQMATRYSDVYDAHRQSQLAGNFVRGEIAL